MDFIMKKVTQKNVDYWYNNSLIGASLNCSADLFMVEFN